MPATRSGGHSRTFQTGNHLNKTGANTAQFEKKAVVKAQRPAKIKKQSAPVSPTTKALLDEKVIVAKPNKLPKSTI